MVEVFDKKFNSVLIEADKKFERKKKEYGDSWLHMPFKELRKRLYNEYQEWMFDCDSEAQELEELIDIINISLMLGKRIQIEYTKQKIIMDTNTEEAIRERENA